MPLKKRIVSSDSFVSIDSNKYSVPVKYVGKQVFFRIVYGYRIDIYTSKGELILKTAASDERKAVISNPEHYAAIAKKVSTSIPQIRRDFTGMFTNGAVIWQLQVENSTSLHFMQEELWNYQNCMILLF